jgi:hypothetical protein
MRGAQLQLQRVDLLVERPAAGCKLRSLALQVFADARLGV